MSAPHNDAVLDRVLTRIVSAGNQKSNGRSPRGISSVLQRDGIPARGNVGGDKRRSGSTTKFYANYRVTNPAFGSSSARDSSLAGTNTVVPQIVFAKGILRAPASSSAANAANTTGPVAVPNANAASTKPTSTVILRQPPPQRSASSPQGHLRASRCSSPPLDISGAGTRRRSSPGDARASAGGGIKGGGGGNGGGPYAGRSSSPRHAMSSCSGTVGSPRAVGASRSRSIPKERQSSGAGYGLRSSGGSGDGGMGLLAAATTGGPAAAANDAAVSGAAPLPARGRPGNTITRTAALRALKQQRSTTPDIIAELRAVSSLKAAQQEGSTQAETQIITFPAVGDAGHANPNAGGTATSTRQQQQQQHQNQNQSRGEGAAQAGGASANADTATSSQSRDATLGGLVSRDNQCGVGAGTSAGPARAAGGSGGAPRDTSPHPPAHPPVPQQQQQPLSNPPQKRAATQESQGHVQKQLKQHLQQQQQQPLPPQQLQHGSVMQTQQQKSQEPASAASAAGARSSCVGLEGVGPRAPLEVGAGGPAAAAPPQPTSASSASACRDTGPVWDISEEPSFRSPSPHHTSEPPAHQNGLGAPPAAVASAVLPGNAASAGGASATASGSSSAQHSAAAVVAVAQRQQRAMRQHVQRQFSPSPGRRAVLVPGPLLTEKPTAALRASVSPLPHHRPRSMSLEVGNWQNDVVLAAQTRIRRLEEQVVSLSAQISELQASHADLEFQLEEEQQQGRAAVAAATAAAARRSGGGGGSGRSGGPVPSIGVESADARAEVSTGSWAGDLRTPKPPASRLTSMGAAHLRHLMIA
ncbi:hypothetical protein Vafri_316 [Volvox africanus]|nr:hypothetical protein Vafri_316 [Volvox africanus]